MSLSKWRKEYQPELPALLKDIVNLQAISGERIHHDCEAMASLFPKTWERPVLYFQKSHDLTHLPKRVGVVLSGGQAPGGHNVIIGLYEALMQLNPHSRLFGFLNGPSGIVENKTIEITAALVHDYNNTGGFDMIGSGRTKIETEAQLQAAAKTAQSLNLDGLIVIGGDDSNTNAAVLAEYFAQHTIKTSVIGVPKTIDGDLKNEFIETSFGFDTATKTYAETIGNIQRDSLSAKKYTYFIKIMGRSASHIALECAMKTHPNLTLISEEVAAHHKTLKDIVREIADLICQRSMIEKDYGVIIIPEGIIEFIDEIKSLIGELNNLLSLKSDEHIENPKPQEIMHLLTPTSQNCFSMLPQSIQQQLLMDRDPHGNIQVSKIETERMLIELVEQELNQRRKLGIYKGKFSAQPHFCGYEGRSCWPSNFDATYCKALGKLSALLVDAEASGYMACIRHLAHPTDMWEIAGIPLTAMLHFEERKGRQLPVIKKALVNLEGPVFRAFQKDAGQWRLNDDYQASGPVQFFGPEELTNSVPLTLMLESALEAHI